MLERNTAPVGATDDAVAATRAHGAEAGAPPEKDTPLSLERHRAQTERLRVLVEFLARPVHAYGGAEPDPDIITAYNLAVEAALQGIRRAAAGDA